MLAAITGPFRAALVNGTPCAWLGDGTPIPMAWPVGWRVALSPARLVDETGRVIAVEGQQLRLGGGHGEEVHVAGCGDPAVGAFSVQESAYELTQSAGSG